MTAAPRIARRLRRPFARKDGARKNYPPRNPKMPKKSKHRAYRRARRKNAEQEQRQPAPRRRNKAKDNHRYAHRNPPETTD